jgi:HlyD family secretion protein
MAKKRKNTARNIIALSVILLAVAGAVVFAVYSKREVIVTVQTYKASRRSLTETVVANGKIQPVEQLSINPEVSGEIIDLPVKEGQLVKKGDLLVNIRPDNYIASTNSAHATYQSCLAAKELAQATMVKAELEFKRNEELFNKQLISDSVFLEFKTALDVARADHRGSIFRADQARAALDKTLDDLSKTTIASPISGTITKLKSHKGERVVGTAMMAGTEIMTLASLEEMEAWVDIGEMDVILIVRGQKARLEVDAYRDRTFTGVVTEIANSSKNAATANTGTSQEGTKFEVKIRIMEKEVFRPGMSVTAEIETRYRTNALTVPIQSVTTRLPKPPEIGKTNSVAGTTNAAKDGWTNSVAKAKTNSTLTSSTTNAAAGVKAGDAPKPIEVVFVVEGDRVKMVPVKRGVSDDSHVEIIEGLQEGAVVVSGGYKAINRELEDGKKVVVGTPPTADKEPGK